MGIQIPPDAPYSVQKALRELDEKIDYLVSTVARGVSPSDLSQVYNALSQRIEETYRKPTTLDFNDVFRGGGAHALGYVPDPGATTPDGEHVLTSAGFWGPVLEGLVRAVPAGLGGSSRAQRVVNVLASLSVLNALSAETVRARTINVFGSLYAPPICVRYMSTSALSGALVVWNLQTFDNSGGKIVRQSGDTQIKVTEAGYYRVSCTILNHLTTGAQADLILDQYDSGTSLKGTIIVRSGVNAGVASIYASNVATRVYNCVADDFFTASDIETTATRTFEGNSQYNDFSIERLN